MPKKPKDHTGEKYGRLTVISLTGERKKHGNNAIWLCRCDCGNYVNVSSGELRDGARTKSCGCLSRDFLRELSETHGGTHDRLYGIWMGMRRRCYDKKVKDYARYGGRGITVCDEWHDYAAFKSWALANGYDADAEFSKCTLDRIDVNGNYCPENCRFVSMTVQNNNKRNNRLIEFRGVVKTVREWEKITGSKPGFIGDRLDRGWSVEDALTIPPKCNSNNSGFVGVNL